MLRYLLPAAALLLSGCIDMTLPPEKMPITTEKREFLYDYSVPGASKDLLYTRASEYLAVSYNNSKEVSRVADKERGTIIAKAVMPWNFTSDTALIPYVVCYQNYDIVAIAKDGRARLQLTIVDGPRVASTCSWTLPPRRDYPQIVSQFEDIAKSFGEALKGNSNIEKIRDF